MHLHKNKRSQMPGRTATNTQQGNDEPSPEHPSCALLETAPQGKAPQASPSGCYPQAPTARPVRSSAPGETCALLFIT